MHDIVKFLHDDAIDRLAEIIRRQLNLWVGACLENGQILWLGAGQCIDNDFCQKCQNEGCLCASTYRAWFEKHAKNPTASNYLSCHAGLRGIAVPLFWQGQCQALLFASGFYFEEDERSPEIRLANEITILTRREAKMVLEMLTEMSQQILEKCAAESASILSDSTHETHDFNTVIGNSPAMQAIVNRLDTICSSDAPVLLTGPDGVGKKFLAHIIHQNSTRRNAPFVSVNCRAFQDEQLESELLGHRRGAFIGALSDKIGLLDIADKGTLFLENVDALSDQMQIKLMQILQEKSYQPQGDVMRRDFEIRILAASIKSLSKCVESAEFNRSLYYLLNIFEIELPPLAQRQEDIVPLASYLMAKACADRAIPQKQLSNEVLALFQNYSWPDNILELENEIEHIIAQPSHDNLITTEHVSDRIRHTASVRNAVVDAIADIPNVPDSARDFALLPGQNLQDALEEIERRIITHALQQTAGNRTKTAEILGVSRRNLIRKIENLHIDE
ncbi:MAG: sigma 54-interacting transcriptional regulator [Proteobacteria bacterium]|nr:sigma 54-interacting transcriptional regulator [Pseudomonadota bacterium]